MPREPSPEPTLPRNSDYAQPCPHCLPGNPFGWRCPQPITDPEMNRDNAWLLEDGAPPGHGYCGNW
jgi:E3 ubiquitin-protein ligase CHFR